MAQEQDDTVQVLRSVWAAQGQGAADLEEVTGATKVCRNMRDFTFDGFADEGTDLREAWRQRLEREGKLAGGGGSIRDLVLGDDAGRLDGNDGG